jgi:predicted PhzF superfamily epimerase YddE/YHI9
MQTGGQKDMTRLIVAFRNFANAPEIDLCRHPEINARLHSYWQKNCRSTNEKMEIQILVGLQTDEARNWFIPCYFC